MNMSRLNVSRKMKLGDPAAQCDIQSVCSDDKLDDMGILSFVRDRFNSMTFTHITLAGSATGAVRKIAQSVRFRASSLLAQQYSPQSAAAR